MRLTSSSVARLAVAASDSDRTATLTGAPGEPFRAALRAVGTASLPGALADDDDSSDPDAPADRADHRDDTMAPAAAQAAYLARLTAVPSASPTARGRLISVPPLPARTPPPAARATRIARLAIVASPGTPTAKPGRRTRRATPADSLESAAAALTLGSLGVPLRTRGAPPFSSIGDAASDASGAAALDPTAAPLPGIAAALTPLEQAVHDLVTRLDAVESPRDLAARSRKAS